MSSKGNEKCNSDTEEYDPCSADEKELKKELWHYLDTLNLAPRKKKLLVMNLNGFLLKRVHCSDKSGILESQEPDQKHGNFSLYKRPFSEEFMKFCFERFEVGVWSTAMEHNIGAALTCAMGSLSNKLLFTWDQDECTRSTGYCLENQDKRIFFKKLNKVFDTINEGGPYSTSNTLMIDDKPYKAFLNPLNTAIFPESYEPQNRNDNALDPNGELCIYLKGVADAIDVQLFVKDHPFGKPAITISHSDWFWYSMIADLLP